MKLCFYCNLVLNCDQYNVKARYRRGLAFKNLNLFNEALKDFEAASKLDPNNKDVTRELHSMVECIVKNLSCKQVGYQFDPLASDRKGKKPFHNKDVVDGSNLITETTEASSSFVLPDISSAQRKVVSNSHMVTDLLNTTPPVPCFVNSSSTFTSSLDRMDDDNEVSLDSAMNVSCTPPFNQNQGVHFLNFNNKKSGNHSHLKIDASSYSYLLQGKEIHVHQHKFLSTMKIRFHTLSQNKIQTGTPHEEISREAAVPPSNPLYEMRNEISSDEASENAELIDEEVILHIDKKKCVTLDSSVVSKISMEQFHFGALKEHSSKICSRKKVHFKGRDQMVRGTGKFKTKYLVSIEQLTFVCRCTRTGSIDKKTKRKDVDLIQFDDHYHPPFKKRRLCSKSSQDSWISSSFGVASIPQFVY